MSKFPMNFHREIVPDAYLGTFQQTTEEGSKLGRVLSLVDKLYRPDKDGKRAINVDQWLAAGTLRNMIMLALPPSEGVSSYGQSVRASEPSTKADRRGRYYTGYRIVQNGQVLPPGHEDNKKGGRHNRSDEWELQDALDAAVGKGNRRDAEILVRVVIQTEAMPTLTQLTLEMTDYYGSKSKQTPPFALGVIRTWLTSLHLHFKETGRA